MSVVDSAISPTIARSFAPRKRFLPPHSANLPRRPAADFATRPGQDEFRARKTGHGACFNAERAWLILSTLDNSEAVRVQVVVGPR